MEDIINKISSLLALKPDQYSPDDIVQLIQGPDIGLICYKYD